MGVARCVGTMKTGADLGSSSPESDIPSHLSLVCEFNKISFIQAGPSWLSITYSKKRLEREWPASCLMMMATMVTTASLHSIIYFTLSKGIQVY